MQFEPGQLVTHSSQWTFGVGQKNKYIVLKVTKGTIRKTTFLQLFCFNGWHYGRIMNLDSQGMVLWK